MKQFFISSLLMALIAVPVILTPPSAIAASCREDCRSDCCTDSKCTDKKQAQCLSDCLRGCDNPDPRSTQKPTTTAPK